MRNRLILWALLAAAFYGASYLVAPAKAANVPMSESDIFDTKLKCAKQGKKMLDHENVSSANWQMSVSTNYDFDNHHCYVRLSMNARGSTEEIINLYDGITEEVIAFTKRGDKNTRLVMHGAVSDKTYWSGAAKDYWNQCKDNYGQCTYDLAKGYIDNLMTTKRN